MKKAFVLSAVFLMVGGVLAADDGGLTPDEISVGLAPSTAPEEWSPPVGSTGSPDWYGTVGRFWIVGAAALSCQPVTSSSTWSQTFNWYYGTSGSPTYWDCTLQAPTGILIDGFEVETFDDDATDNVCAYFWRQNFYSTTHTVIGSGCSSGTEGYDAIYVTGLGETIENHWHVYSIRVVANSGTSSNKFRVLAYSAYRQISPAPGTATFPDVAPGYWAFQEIEALAASGITTGYPDGTYKPTALVTRAQMATFLARALGLHWKDQ